jgi:hypothetical protein
MEMEMEVEVEVKVEVCHESVVPHSFFHCLHILVYDSCAYRHKFTDKSLVLPAMR